MSISYIHFYYQESIFIANNIDIDSITIRYRQILVMLLISIIANNVDVVMYLLDQLYCCRGRRYRFLIAAISSCSCWINFIAFDIDTISFCDIVGSAVLLSISSISI